MVKDGVLSNIDFSDFNTCVECIKGKLTAKVIREMINRCENVLNLIHTNTCGPFTQVTLGSFRYFISFIDDFSHYGHIE